jgi:hypothetical protein
MRAVEVRRQGTNSLSIVLTNALKPALFAEFVLPFIHVSNTDQSCTGKAHTSMAFFLQIFSLADVILVVVDIPDNGQLMFVLGTIILYPQCRVELSVLRQQMLESGGKKVLLTAAEAGAEESESFFESSLDKVLDNLRKVLSI